jgi:hypothetical protein
VLLGSAAIGWLLGHVARTLADDLPTGYAVVTNRSQHQAELSRIDATFKTLDPLDRPLDTVPTLKDPCVMVFHANNMFGYAGGCDPKDSDAITAFRLDMDNETLEQIETVGRGGLLRGMAMSPKGNLLVTVPPATTSLSAGGGCNMVPAHAGAAAPWLAAFGNIGLPFLTLALMQALRWRRGSAKETPRYAKRGTESDSPRYTLEGIEQVPAAEVWIDEDDAPPHSGHTERSKVCLGLRQVFDVQQPRRC